MRKPEHTWWRVFGPPECQTPVMPYATRHAAIAALEKYSDRDATRVLRHEGRVAEYSSRDIAKAGQASDAIGENGRLS